MAFRELAQGGVVVGFSLAKTGPKKIWRPDEEGEMVRGARRNR